MNQTRLTHLFKTQTGKYKVEIALIKLTQKTMDHTNVTPDNANDPHGHLVGMKEKAVIIMAGENAVNSFVHV